MANVDVQNRSETHRAHFRWGIAGFLAGCLVAPSLGTAFFWGVVALAIAAMAWGSLRQARRETFFRIGLGCLLAIAGWGWAGVELGGISATERKTETFVSDKKVPVTLRVTQDVRWSDTGATLEGNLLSWNGIATPEYGVRIYLPGNFRPEVGAVVRGDALLGRPEGAAGPGAARSFRVRGIFLSAYVASPRVTPGDPGWVGRFRKSVLDIFDDTYPARIRAVMAGILLGDGTSLDKTTTTNFRTSGLAHMLVASGSNVVIVLMALGIFARRLPAPLNVAIPAAGAVLFAALAGGGVPVVRAALMGLAVLAVSGGGRKSDGGHVLLAALAAFAVAQPLSLAWDPSLRLSFCATAGAMFLARPLAARMSLVPETWGLREAAATALAAALSTLPVSAADFGTVSLASLPANLAAGWAVAPAMVLGSVSALFRWFPPIRDLFGFGAWVVTSWIVAVADVSSGWRWASFPVGPWVGWMAVAIGACLAVWRQKKTGETPVAERTTRP